MFHGKCKAVTFSYDDGVSQDVRLIALLDKYGLKATFNLNSEMFGKCCKFNGQGARLSPTTFCRQRKPKNCMSGPRGCRPHADAPQSDYAA